MANEVERKFVLEQVPAEAARVHATAIEQGYLAVDEETEVRLRRADGKRQLTVKRGHGESREEIEVELCGEQFEALWPLTAGRRLRKTRYRLPLGEGLVAEVDRYVGEHAGLVVAEVEFASLEASQIFRPPGWLGREVTGDPGYANQRLAMNGSSGRVADRGGSHGGKGAYRLRPDEPAAAGIKRIADARARKAGKKLAEVEQEGATAIHGARKDLKKLRAVLRLIREPLGEKAYKKQNRRFRDAGRLLSDTRDAEVKVETLEDLEERFGAEFLSAAVASWRADLERERYAVAADPGGQLAERVEKAAAKIAVGRAEIKSWPLEKDSWKLLEPGVLSAYREGRKAFAAVRKEPRSDSVHEWRKRAKDLWYQLRILRDLWPAVLGETADQAHDLADLLGDHHDLAVLGEDLSERDLLEPEAVRELIEHRQEELLGGALEIGARLYAEQPRAFRKRLAAYWDAARG